MPRPKLSSRRLKRGLPHAVSAAAVYWALTGTATATALISGALIIDESITSSDVRNGSLLAKDFAAGQLPA
ncbi:MAG: hypothetical protein JHD16_18430, partial [Solirubrobacteraceae bacterium]|nr:hypothetical protein [Solirubrobacteraceae bacterium]